MMAQSLEIAGSQWESTGLRFMMDHWDSASHVDSAPVLSEQLQAKQSQTLVGLQVAFHLIKGRRVRGGVASCRCCRGSGRLPGP